MSTATSYDNSFYEFVGSEAVTSAAEVVPYIVELIKPQRVVDVGCGQGCWAAEFIKQDVPHVTGLDGDYVDRSRLMIPEAQFIAADLTQPCSLEETFDLAISLEVAEHILPECDDTFIDTLTGLSPVVLFSAAIPHQTGVDHVNEQWQDYWKDKFAARGYLPADCVRPVMWNNKKVAFYYAQNMILYVKSDYADTIPQVSQALAESKGKPLSCVHPRMWLHMKNPRNQSLREVLKALWFSIGNSIRYRLPSSK